MVQFAASDLIDIGMRPLQAAPDVFPGQQVIVQRCVDNFLTVGKDEKKF